MNKHLKFLQEHKIQDGLLREFVFKELWSASIKACEDSIAKRRTEITIIKEMRSEIMKEEKK